MKCINRITAIVMVFVLIISLCPNSFTVRAASARNATIAVETVSALPGSTVDVNVYVTSNPGIMGATLQITYDESLTLVGAENGEAFSALDMTHPGKYVSGCKFNWDALELAEEEIVDGIILTLTFEVAEDVDVNKNLEISLSCNTSDVFNSSFEDVTIAFVTGGVAVINYLPGDVNSDDVVNAKDVIFLRRHITGGYDIEINESAGDVNNDGNLNSKDVILIRRYITGGYDVELLPSTLRCNHTMESIAYKAATCTEDGNVSYCYCTTCEKYYNDSDGSVELSLQDTVLEATGHTVVIDAAVTPTYDSTGLTEGSHCSVCHQTLVAQEIIAALEKDEYAITYNLTYNDTYLSSIEINNPNPGVYTTQDGLALAEPMVDGYIFEGWYDGQGSTANKVTKIEAGSTGAVTLYAHWSAVEYTITFNSPLAATSSQTYKVNTGATLTNPSYYGYTFVGWSDENGDLISKIPTGTTGNITLTANWTSKRNQTVPVTSLDDPLIVEDEENGMLFFTYYIGRMENVPLYTIKDFGYNSGGGITWSETVEYSYNISEENATSVANTVAEATTTTSSWTLSQGWNSLTSISETQSSSTTSEQMAAYSQSFEQTGAYSIGSSVGGSKTTTTEAGISSKISATASEKANVSASLGVEDAGVKAGVSAGYEVGYSVTGEVGGSYTETEENSKNWSTSSSFEASRTAGADFSVSSSLSSSISEEYSYGQSYGSSEEFEESNELAVSSSKETEYGSTFVYATDTSTSVTKTYSNEGSTDGYYRLVAAGTIHVFAVVGYDIATSSYFVYTYNVMDDKTYEFMDYSATTQGYDDLQNGVLAFEVPYEVNTYVDSLTLTTNGLVVDIETGMITDYTGTADHVMIPEYMTVDNGDETVTVVHIAGIEAGAFAGNTSVVEVKLPDTVTEIPASTFKDCTSLTGVIANNIASIGDEAFSGCTSLANYTVDVSVTELGENVFKNVPSITVNAHDTNIVKAAAASGAQAITLNLTSMEDVLEDYTFNIPNGTNYFAFNGGGNTYNNVRIVSDATETVINAATLVGCEDTPLVLSSEKVTLNRVTVEANGLAMLLTAETTDISLYGTVKLNTSSSDAIHSNSLVMSLLNTSVSSKMNVTGNVLVCGTVTNEKYISVTNGEIICYSAEDSCLINFDANGGTVAENSRIVACGSAVGELPEASKSGYVFYGWVDEDGNLLTAETTVYSSGEMTVYAQWTEPYTITWSNGTGYTITVNRTASPKGKATTGTLNSGDTIYPEDVLSITYTATTGYTLATTGVTSIIVSGNVTSSSIFATATANSYTYNIVYVSSNGTALGTTTATYAYGTTNTISPAAYSGYTTPAAQSVVWDSTTAKTITFTYTPIAATNSTKTGTLCSSPKVTYSAKIEYRNRTATSVQIRIVWTSTIAAYNYDSYGQKFKTTIGSSSATTTVNAFGTWSSSTSSARSSTGTSDWITVSLSTTNATTVSASIYYYQVNSNGTDMTKYYDAYGLSTTWTINVPAY